MNLLHSERDSSASGRVVVGGLVLLVLVVASVTMPTMPVLAVLALVGLALFVVFFMRIEPGVIFAFAVGGAIFSGFGSRIGLPISPDRPLFLLAIGALVGGAPLGGSGRPRLRWRAIHTWMLITIGVVIALGISSDSFLVDEAIFALLDRLGIVPFIAFLAAPILYAQKRQRAVLLGVLVGVGWYLGVTAVLEGFGLRNLTWPAYINDPSIGLHFERARGPFVESTGFGLSMIGCIAGGVIAALTWRGRITRLLAVLVIPVLMLGCLLTLTRAVWLAVIVSSLVGIAVHPRSRRFLVPIVFGGILSVGLALLVVPGLSDSVTERRTERVAVWDRFNSNQAAIVAFEQKPLTGIGWSLFAKRSDPYLFQSEDYPLTGHRIEVHNVLLSRLAEIGLLGTVPWLFTMALGIAVPAIRKPPSYLAEWRLGLLMFGSAWAVMGMFGPVSTAFPNLLMWLIAGIVASPMTTREAASDRRDAPGRKPQSAATELALAEVRATR